MSKALTVILMAAVLAGCSATAGDFCLVSAPIRPSVQDQLTEGTARQVLAHNEYGERVCRWRP